ncbi:hypothetical protein [Segnochrobactrum spirostomi]|uniref:Molybdopterin-dependent oxidoreductase n=1 Tax=Segnochrobactrum spirostomi TaxID=2608987 RepID=A0A6A7Y469_9HYPH|nr:hypothetical protein [Segnochrobactrum spirostomi]MQT13516.1 hypothetical protein [Segnochrobactrum spirostomi]
MRFVRVLAVFVSFACASLALVAAAPPAFAQDLDLDWKTADGQVLKSETLDLKALDTLPQATIKTSTPWTQGVQTFSGPTLSAIAALGGRPVKEADVVALNDYSIVIPAQDWKKYTVVLASRHNGATMRVRDKGPLWVIYPLDTFSELEKQETNARMVWQVAHITFVVE